VTDGAQGFAPWHFEEADANKVTIKGCNYSNYRDYRALDILGDYLIDTEKERDLGGFDEDCRTFTLPTAALDRSEVVLDARRRNRQSTAVHTY